MSVSKAVRKLYKILVDNNFEPLSPQELSEISGYKNVNSIDQVLSRNEDFFSVQGGMGNRKVSIPKDKKSLAIFIRDNLHCVYCNQQVTVENATIDHIAPDNTGKLGDPSNLATACKSCNNLKGNQNVLKFINDMLPKDRQMIANENIKRIAGKVPGKKVGKSNRRKSVAPSTSTISDENKLKMLIRQVVQSELNKKRKCEYKDVYLIEKSGHWACIEDGDEWTIDDDGQPISTMIDLLNDLALNGWRCVQLMEFTQYRIDMLSIGKQYMAILEKAL